MAFLRTAAALTALSSLFTMATAQTYTDCNPMNGTCPPNPALGTNATFDFSAGKPSTDLWNTTMAGIKYGAAHGAEYTIYASKESPTHKTNFYIMWGEVTVQLQAAKGQGIVSSIFLQSDDLDEVDWEWIGGNTTHVQSNYFGKGNQTTYDRSAWHTLPDNASPMDGFHNYTVKWTKEQIEWLIDNVSIRTLPYAAANGGHNYPQTPMNVRIGVWAGGDVTNNAKGVVEWAGGPTDFKKGPFSMYVKSVYVKDYTDQAKDYTWTDRTGSYQSIKATTGDSKAYKILKQPTTKASMQAKWATMSPGTRTAVIAGAIAGASIIVLGLLFCCWRQARKGRREKAVADAQWEKEQAEFNQYRMQMMKGGFGATTQPVYHH